MREALAVGGILLLAALALVVVSAVATPVTCWSDDDGALVCAGDGP